MSFEKHLSKFFFKPVDSIKLDTYRVALALTIIFYMFERWQFAGEWLTPLGYHPTALNLPFHPMYVPLLPEEALPWFGVILFLSLLSFLIGFKLHISTWVVLICLVYVTLADQLSAFTVNKLMIVSLLVLALAGRGRYYSIPKGDNKTITIWPIRVLQLTFILQFFFAGFAKVYFGSWFHSSHSLWAFLQGYYRNDFVVWLYLNIPFSFWVVAQWTVLLLELFSPIWFGLKATRKYAVVMAFLFFLMIILTMYKIHYFGFFMMSYLVLFISDKTLLKCYTCIQKFNVKISDQ